MHMEVAAKWVEALRSGKFKQGKGALCRPDGTGHCCLGVLTELYLAEGEEGWDAKPYVISDMVAASATELSKGEKLNQLGGEAFGLPEDVRKWAGMVDNEGAFGYLADPDGSVPDRDRDTTRDTLGRMNDNDSTFAEIAEVIERDWEYL